MSNENDINDAKRVLMTYLSPYVCNKLIDVHGENWWNVAITYVDRKDVKRYSRISKDSERIETIDVINIHRIMEGRRSLYIGSRTSNDQVIDARFYDLLHDVRLLRGSNAHLGMRDISDKDRNDCLNIISQLCYYFTDDADEKLPVLYKETTKQKGLLGSFYSIVKNKESSSNHSNNEQHGNTNKSANEAKRDGYTAKTSKILDKLKAARAENKKDGETKDEDKSQKKEDEILENNPSKPENEEPKEFQKIDEDANYCWKSGNDSYGNIRYGCYLGDTRISNSALVDDSGRIIPLDESHSATGHVLKSYGNGDYYDGMFLDGVCEGIGKRYDSKGVLTVSGLFHEDSLIGPMTFKDNYDPTYPDDMIHEIEITLNDGGLFKGHFCNGSINGPGTFYPIGSKSITGIFCNNRFIGKTVTLHSCDETEYFMTHLFEYEGMISIINEDSEYNGYWTKGKREGPSAVYIVPGNYIYRGPWIDDHASGEGRCEFVSGDSYEGEFYDGMYHGFGLFEAKDGYTYKGEFSYGYRFGHGEMACEGYILSCDWRNDSPHGPITVDKNGERVYEGVCKRGYLDSTCDENTALILIKFGITVPENKMIHYDHQTKDVSEIVAIPTNRSSMTVSSSNKQTPVRSTSSNHPNVYSSYAPRHTPYTNINSGCFVNGYPLSADSGAYER